jgi:predicted alpha/beta superfamily hydrolase
MRDENSAVNAAPRTNPLLPGWLPADPSLPAPRTHTGDVRYLGRLRSARLDNLRDVWIWLPPGYDASAARYPVIYFHDGQNVFDSATAFAGVEWQADEALQQLVSTGSMREAIAVAVANTPRRIDEYTQLPDPRHPGGGRARDYLEFLVRDLKPRIDAAFRTLPWREDTAIIGSSLGGLVSLDAGVRFWHAFGLVGALSPVFDWANYDIETRYATASPSHLPLRIWIDMGTAEDETPYTGETPRLVGDLRRFRTVLERRGFAEGRNLGYEEATGATHDEGAWAARLPRVLSFLLPATPAPEASPAKDARFQLSRGRSGFRRRSRLPAAE